MLGFPIKWKVERVQIMTHKETKQTDRTCEECGGTIIETYSDLVCEGCGLILGPREVGHEHMAPLEKEK